MTEKKSSFKLTVPCDLAGLGLVQAFVRESALLFGFHREDLPKIELAVEEAVVNVVQHAFSDEEDPATFDVITERTPLGMGIAIREKGIPFDPQRLPSYDRAADIDQVSTSGMGMFLMRESMDEVSFHNLGPEGKETRLVKYLPHQDIETYLQPDELNLKTPAKPEAPPVKENCVYTVRAMQSDEAIGVSRLAYKTHGYTFFDDLIYYPERLVEMNRAGEMISSVAVTDAHEFMGHAALVYFEPGAKIAEYTFVFVDQAFRNLGCMTRLCQYLVGAPKPHPLTGIYSYSVANHVFTQRGILKLGFRDCGILLATSPATWKFKGIAEPNEQRISVVLSFDFLEPPSPRTLYAPGHHRDIIKRIYANIDSPHTFEAPEWPKPRFDAQPSQIQTHIYPVENCASITVARYGSDIVREIKAILRDLCLKQIAAIDLFLPLEDPNTAFVPADLETLGFFFSGVLPETPTGDVLILQYLNNINLDYDQVHVYSDVAKDLLAYIKQHDPNANI